jgi:hypothetical protein
VLLIFVSGKVVLTGAHGVTPCRQCGRGLGVGPGCVLFLLTCQGRATAAH